MSQTIPDKEVAELEERKALTETEKPKKPTTNEKIEMLELELHNQGQLLKSLIDALQSAENAQKQAPASPTSQNQLVPQLAQDKSTPLALDPSIFPALIKMLGFGGEPQQDPFHEAGKIMFESFANSIMQTSGRIIAKEARTIKHDHY